MENVAERKAGKQGIKSKPFFGEGEAVIFFVCDATDPSATWGQAIQSNIPYYGLGYDAYTTYSKLHNVDTMVDAELLSTICEKWDRTPPAF